MQTSIVTTAAGASTVLEETAVQKFKESLSGELLHPDAEGYEQARRVWNGIIDKRPALIARCRGAADVIQAVNFARTHELLVAVRGGGHNVAGHAVCDGGIVIDLSPMRAVHVDPEAQTAYVEGGALWGDVDRETQVFGLAVPGGVVSYTGVAGLTLGGGYGWLRGKYGLTCDCLLSVDIVTADGQFLKASPTRHPDLFWGIRGGGGNFGIVTGFEFRLFAVGPQFVLCAPLHAAKDVRRGMRAWRDFMLDAPDEFTSDCVLWSVPADPHFPEEAWGKNVFIPAGVYCGEPAAGEQFIQPLRKLGEPVLDLSRPVTYQQVQTGFDPFFRKGEFLHYWKALYLDKLSDEAIELIVDCYERRPSLRTLISIRYHAGAVRRVEATATAFGDRSAQVLVSLDATWHTAQDSEKNIAWARDSWAALRPYSGGRTYFNFPGLLEEGDELVRTTFGANYERLVALKNKYDPTNLFRLNQNIQPTVRAKQGL
jgi:FAD/FMN-containing dehydrogenase